MMRNIKLYTQKIKGLMNTRDLGGIPTEDGKEIKSCKLLRSGKLYKLSKKTRAIFKEKGVTTVVDLRIETEKSDYPDDRIEGTNYIQLPLVCTATAGITTEKTMFRTMIQEGKRIEKEFGTANNYMIETYRAVLFNEDSKAVLKEFFRLVLKEEGCILWHCSSGKDRAGICAMLLEALLGVSEEVIMEDYMLSRKFCRAHYARNRLAMFLVPFGFKTKKIVYGFMRTREIFLRTVIEDLDRDYGGIVGYCKKELGITEKDIDLLKKKYLIERK